MFNYKEISLKAGILKVLLIFSLIGAITSVYYFNWKSESEKSLSYELSSKLDISRTIAEIYYDVDVTNKATQYRNANVKKIIYSQLDAQNVADDFDRAAIEKVKKSGGTEFFDVQNGNFKYIRSIQKRYEKQKNSELDSIGIIRVTIPFEQKPIAAKEYLLSTMKNSMYIPAAIFLSMAILFIFLFGGYSRIEKDLKNLVKISRAINDADPKKKVVFMDFGDGEMESKNEIHELNRELRTIHQAMQIFQRMK